MTSKGIRGKITPEFLQKLKENVNLVDVVSEHVVLRKSGSNFSGLCPFHSERSPSFSVSEQKQLYHCYGCKQGGDLLKFVMEIHAMSFVEAVEELAGRAKVAMPKDWSGTSDLSEAPEAQAKRAAAQERLALAFKLNRFAAAFYHQALNQQAHIQKYFLDRGVNSELGRAFYTGAAPAAWDALSAHLVSKQAPLQVAVELGLIRPSPKGRADGPGFFDLFRNRAMFPILDTRGRVAGFGGRALESPEGSPDVGGASPKYLNSPESLLFQKSKLVYGLYQSQKHIREKDEVILVEGYFDVLALHAAGFENVVATCGTSLTAEHLNLVKRLCSRVTVLFDGDKAGVSATERAMELGLDYGLVLYGAALPPDLDPDEVLFDQKTGSPLSEGKTQMASILSASQPLLDTRIAQSVKDAAQGPQALAEAVKQIGIWLGRFKDPVGREVRVQAAAKSLGVPQHLLKQAMGEKSAVTPVNSNSGPSVARRPVPNSPAKHPSRGPTKISQREQIILAAIARGGTFSELIASARKNLPDRVTFSDLFDYIPAKEFVTSIFQDPAELDRFRKAPEEFLGGDLDSQVRSILAEALLATDSPFPESEVRLALDRCIAKSWARFSQQIIGALADAEAKKDAGLQSELMKVYLDVQRKIKEFSCFYDEA